MEPVSTTVSVALWVAFWLVVLIALFVDLTVLNKHHGKVSLKEALVQVPLQGRFLGNEAFQVNVKTL